MPRLTPRELELELDELTPVFIFPPILDCLFIDGVGDEMECGSVSEASICLPGYDIYFPIERR